MLAVNAYGSHALHRDILAQHHRGMIITMCNEYVDKDFPKVDLFFDLDQLRWKLGVPPPATASDRPQSSQSHQGFDMILAADRALGGQATNKTPSPQITQNANPSTDVDNSTVAASPGGDYGNSGEDEDGNTNTNNVDNTEDTALITASPEQGPGSRTRKRKRLTEGAGIMRIQEPGREPASPTTHLQANNNNERNIISRRRKRRPNGQGKRAYSGGTDEDAQSILDAMTEKRGLSQNIADADFLRPACADVVQKLKRAAEKRASERRTAGRRAAEKRGEDEDVIADTDGDESTAAATLTQRESEAGVARLFELFGRAFGDEGATSFRSFLHLLQHHAYNTTAAAAAPLEIEESDDAVAAALSLYRAQASIGASALLDTCVRSIRLAEFSRRFDALVASLADKPNPVWDEIKDQKFRLKRKRLPTVATEYLLWKLEGYSPNYRSDEQEKARKRLHSDISNGRLLAKLESTFGTGIFVLLSPQRHAVFRGWTHPQVEYVADKIAQNLPDLKKMCQVIHNKLLYPLLWQRKNGCDIVASSNNIWDGRDLMSILDPPSGHVIGELDAPGLVIRPTRRTGKRQKRPTSKIRD